MDRGRALTDRVPSPALGLFLVGSVLLGVAAGSEPSSLVVGVLGAVVCAWGLAAHAVAVLPAASGYVPAVAARALHRALARRAVPRQRDPDAAGHTRARAPSGLLPAV